ARLILRLNCAPPLLIVAALEADPDTVRVAREFGQTTDGLAHRQGRRHPVFREGDLPRTSARRSSPRSRLIQAPDRSPGKSAVLVMPQSAPSPEPTAYHSSKAPGGSRPSFDSDPGTRNNKDIQKKQGEP